MSQVRQIRSKMFNARNSKSRLNYMYLVRGLEWRTKKTTTLMVAIESTDEDWFLGWEQS